MKIRVVNLLDLKFTRNYLLIVLRDFFNLYWSTINQGKGSEMFLTNK